MISHHGSCSDCKTELHYEVMRSNAGYYVGTGCECGPYSRESGYFRKREDAEKQLAFIERHSQ